MNDETPAEIPSPDDLASMYLDQLPYDPYPVQEEALLAWYEDNPGILVCAPTGTGKTLIAEAAMFEALHTGKTAYYTTPLIALTEQKFQEMQDAAVRWGFSPDDIGLVTGNRRVNPDAKVLVVVAEILLNRLLHPTAFDMSDVSAVVMDEFHSFNDRERGIVWELSLTMMPEHVRLMLLSATVGNTVEFLQWLNRCHGRKLRLVQGSERRVPLSFHWVPDQLLNEQLELMAEGTGEQRMTPALLFCFNRNECWDVAEQLKGKSLISKNRQKQLSTELDQRDFSTGVGQKLKQILMRGVGVHHAGLLPKYRRVVEELFQQKLLAVTVCTETLAAGMNLPARSVVLRTLLKGPAGKKKLIEPSSAHQMFGRAGRPQYDTQGHVFALASEDDVKILRWKEKFDQIPEDTKDPLVLKQKKKMKKKMPTRRSTEQYWSESQFQQLQQSSPANLESKGTLPWRLLAYLITLSPDVIRLRSFVRKRLMPPKGLDQAERELQQMLKTLWAGGYVTLEPEPPPLPKVQRVHEEGAEGEEEAEPELQQMGMLGQLLAEANVTNTPKPKKKQTNENEGSSSEQEKPDYEARLAHPTEELPKLLALRSVNPVYGLYVLDHMHLADENERLQLLESLLEIPRSVGKAVRVPWPDQLPRGPLENEYLNSELLSRGVATQEELQGITDEERPWENRPPLPVADKLRMLFRSEFPAVTDFRINSVWVAGELLRFNADFDKYIKARELAKQEGLVFRHCLRLILLCGEFAQLAPSRMDPRDWSEWLNSVTEQLTESCRKIDPESTDKAIESAGARADVVEDEFGF